MPESNKSSRSPRSTTPTTPEDYPVSSPTATSYPLAALDQSFVIQMMMDLKATVAALKESVDTLKEQSKEQGKEVTQLAKDVHAAKVVVGVVGTLIVAVLGFVGWVAKTYLDYLATSPHKP